MNEFVDTAINIGMSNLIFLCLFFGGLSAISTWALLLAIKGNSEAWIVAMIGIAGSVFGYLGLPTNMILPAIILLLISCTSTSYFSLRK